MLKLNNLKRFLMVGFFSIHLAYSVEMHGVNDVAILREEIQIAARNVREQREDHGDANSVIFIGRTGCGKSTLITHLAGRTLLAEAGVDGFTLDTEDPLHGFHIGGGIGVGTEFPVAWYDPVTNIRYWDCPGFGDPRGPRFDIINAFSIHQLFQGPSQTKIVITVEEPDVTGRADSFGRLLNRVIDTFPDSDQLRRCLSLVVTKHRPEVSVEGKLEKIFTSREESENFRGPVKDLIRFLHDNARVSCMPYPVAAGIYDPEAVHRDAILRSIDPLALAGYVLNPAMNIPGLLDPAARELMVGLEAFTNDRIRTYVHDRIGAEINRVCEGFITGREKTGRTLKADFATYLGILQTVRFDAAEHFITDLYSLLGTVGIAPLMGEIHDRISCLEFFRVINGSVVYRPDQWKLALEDIINRLESLAQAPESVALRRGRHLRDTHTVTREWKGGPRRTRHQEWSDCHIYAIDEQITTTFPDGPSGALLRIIDDWTETSKTDSVEYFRGEH